MRNCRPAAGPSFGSGVTSPSRKPRIGSPTRYGELAPDRIRRTVDSIDPAHGPPGSRRGASGCVRNESRGQSAIGTSSGIGAVPRHAGRSSTPVICETLADQGVVGQGLVHRHQLDRGDTEALQVADYGRVGQPRIRALQLRRYIRMKLREAADMGLVDDRVRVRGLRGPVPLLVESRIYYDRTDRVWRAVGHAGPQRGEIHLVSEQRVGSTDRAVNRLGVRVQEQLARVAHLTLDRIPRPVDPVAVVLLRADTEYVAVPDEAIDLAKGDARFVPARIEQTEVYFLGGL